MEIVLSEPLSQSKVIQHKTEKATPKPLFAQWNNQNQHNPLLLSGVAESWCKWWCIYWLQMAKNKALKKLYLDSKISKNYICELVVQYLFQTIKIFEAACPMAWNIIVGV